MRRGMLVIPRRWRRRPPFSVALVGLVVGLTALTAAAMGTLAWQEQRGRSRMILDATMTRTAHLAASHADRLLRDAEAVARLGPELVAERQLDTQDTAALERFTLAVLRAHPELSWVSYGDRDDRFVGAWRDGAGSVYINRSFPHAGRIRLEEDRLLPGGGRVRVRSSDDHGYHPSERPYFLAASARRDVAWTEPYQFYAGGGLGITCAAPVIDAGGRIRGVFTIDFSLERLAEALEPLEVSPRGRVFIATRAGSLLVGPRGEGLDATAVDASLVAAVAPRLQRDAASSFRFEHAGERYLGRGVPLTAGDLAWVVEVLVPERDYTEHADAQARVTIVLGVIALVLALAGGIVVVRWIAQPLRALAWEAGRIRQGHLDVSLLPRSHDELGVLTRAMIDMARTLRDRDFIRETLGRYVSPELADQCLRNRGAVRLGGELRRVTIVMSDLRDFSELSERLGPEAMIDLINRYLARMTPVILQHGGVINEFIGDAILILFGAPFERADDSDRAVRCAWAMQQAMVDLNAENRALGLPELAMGIGVHSGVVVAGNIGSKDRVKYGVVGPAVNLTARIQALARGGQVLISTAVLARVRDVVRVAPAARVIVKGATAPVRVHPVLAVDGARAAIAMEPWSEAAGRDTEADHGAVSERLTAARR
ncbi:MAG TPA: adenylate/guanylate cyclase domain-containing protein [Methylomirabilota bacterium]